MEIKLITNFKNWIEYVITKAELAIARGFSLKLEAAKQIIRNSLKSGLLLVILTENLIL